MSVRSENPVTETDQYIDAPHRDRARMGDMNKGLLIGWGYEGHTLDDLLDTMREWKIDVLADVRLTPISRKRGFSKTRLREACESVDVSYEHLRALGNPKDNREGFASPRSADGGARERFQSEVLTTDEADESLRLLATWRDEGKRVLLLCFEADESCCHRHEVLTSARSLAPVAAS